MKNLPNIEKSAFRPGDYVGYAHGVWFITRSGRHGWTARHRDEFPQRPSIQASTLEALSVQLGNVTSLPSRDRLPVVSFV